MLLLRRIVEGFQPLLELLIVFPSKILCLVLENSCNITSSPVNDVAVSLSCTVEYERKVMTLEYSI